MAGKCDIATYKKLLPNFAGEQDPLYLMLR